MQQLRPRKRILLIDTDEDRMGARKFMLNQYLYAVDTVSNADQAADWLDGTVRPDLIVVAWPLKDKLLTSILRVFVATNVGTAGMIPVLLLSQDPQPKIFSNATLSEYCSSAQLLERVRVMARAKRGPRKGFRTMFPEVAS